MATEYASGARDLGRCARWERAGRRLGGSPPSATARDTLTEGERWTAEVLEQLRRRRYRPAAWIAFVARSLERSRASRSQRPELVRQAAVWGVAGGLTWSAASVAARRHPARARPRHHGGPRLSHHGRRQRAPRRPATASRVRSPRRAPRGRTHSVAGCAVRSRAAPRDPRPAVGRAAALRRPRALRRRPTADRHAGPRGGLLRPATLDRRPPCRRRDGGSAVMSALVLGLAAGFAAGAVMTRWGLCFNRAVRRAAFERRPSAAAGVRHRRGDAAAAAAAADRRRGRHPRAQRRSRAAWRCCRSRSSIGGLVFGAGMALAGGCVTGMLWKAGAGAAALGIAIAGFAVGEILVRERRQRADRRARRRVASRESAR